jgi:hypothetical protein
MRCLLEPCGARPSLPGLLPRRSARRSGVTRAEAPPVPAGPAAETLSVAQQCYESRGAAPRLAGSAVWQGDRGVSCETPAGIGVVQNRQHALQLLELGEHFRCGFYKVPGALNKGE